MADEHRDITELEERAVGKHLRETVDGGLDDAMDTPAPVDSEPPKISTGRAVAVALVGVVVFSLVFIGLVLGLDFAAHANRGEDVSLNAVPSSEPSYVLLIGSDTRKGTAVYTGDPAEHGQADQHADIITLMRIDPREYMVTLVTIPRDTVVPNQDKTLKETLLQGNPQDVVDAAERITGTNIPYYLLVDFPGFEGVVNNLDGVVVDVPVDMEMHSPISASVVNVKAGENRRLNGDEALVVARDMSVYKSLREARRQKMVRALERAMIDRALGMQSELQVENMLRLVESSTVSNIDFPTVGSVLMDFIRHSDKVKVYTATGPYKQVRTDTQGYVVKDDAATWRDIMLAVSNGEDPSTIVPEP